MKVLLWRIVVTNQTGQRYLTQIKAQWINQQSSTVQPFFPAVKMVKEADGEYGEHAGRIARCTAPTFVGGILEPDLMSVSNDQGWSVFAAALSTSGFDLILSPPTQCQVRL